MLDIIEQIFDIHYMNTSRLDGSQSMEIREKNIAKFMDPDSNDVKYMLSSLKIGSEGINLTAANHVPCYILSFNYFVYIVYIYLIFIYIINSLCYLF